MGGLLLVGTFIYLLASGAAEARAGRTKVRAVYVEAMARYFLESRHFLCPRDKVDCKSPGGRLHGV